VKNNRNNCFHQNLNNFKNASLILFQRNCSDKAFDVLLFESSATKNKKKNTNRLIIPNLRSQTAIHLCARAPLSRSQDLSNQKKINSRRTNGRKSSYAVSASRNRASSSGRASRRLRSSTSLRSVMHSSCFASTLRRNSFFFFLVLSTIKPSQK
jgi:hypothetical protein